MTTSKAHSKLVASAAALALLFAACSGGSDDVAGPTPGATTLVPTPADVVDPEPSATLTPTAAATSGPGSSNRDAAETVWNEFWQVISVPDSEAGYPDALMWGTPAAIDRVRFLPWGSTDRDVETFPVLTEQPDGSFAVNDCMFHTPGFAIGGGAIWWAGVVEFIDGKWMVTDAGRVSGIDPCVPATLAEAAIAGYEAYLDAVPVMFEAPSSSSRLLQQTTVGSHRESVRDALNRAEIEGWQIRGGSSNHPEVSSARATDRLLILDCYEPDADYGAYYRSTGERISELVAPLVEGERDKAVVEMVREAGVWKVAGINSVLRDSCEFAPSNFGLPLV